MDWGIFGRSLPGGPRSSLGRPGFMVLKAPLRLVLNVDGISSDQLTPTSGCAGGPAIGGRVIGCERFMIDILVDHYACIPSGAQAFAFRDSVLR